MQRALNILLIEDDTIEVMKMKRVISSIEVHHQLIEAKNGEEALVLPIVLTTSKHRKDLLSCYQLGVAGYVLKPLKYESYVSKVKNLLGYWSMNELIIDR